MNRTATKLKALLLWGALFTIQEAQAVQDTLRVMTYNVLYYGDTPPCQGSHTASHGYLQTIIAYTNPDVIGLEKMAATPGYAPAGFADSIVQFSLNMAFPGRYAYCPFTNIAGANNIDVLFYDQQKLGYLGILCTYSNIADFTTYKLYYKSPDLATTHDTISLYVTLNHTNSGASSSDASMRADQITGEMAQIATHFTTLPNHVNMGDFNTHNSSEACYQTLIAPANPCLRYYDPPFSPDGDLSYPLNWDSNPSACARFLTTSTRLSNLPNSCGSSGGGKSWYDHIFLSAALITNADGLSYISHSYRTIGNDGNRVGKNINDAPTNTSAPAPVIEALFQMSNKFPVTLDLAVNTDNLGVHATVNQENKVQVTNPVYGQLEINIDHQLIGRTITVQCINMLGQILMNITFPATTGSVKIPCTLPQGVYNLRISNGDQVISYRMITKI